MAGGIPLSKALSLISGVPLAKVGTVLAEKLSLTKRLDGGAIGGLLKQVMLDGNLSSIMQNPVAGLTGALQSQIGTLTTQIQSQIPNAGSLITALTGGGGLTAGLSNLTNAGNNLAGLTAGGAGFFDLLGHDNTVSMLGKEISPTLTMDVAAGPVTSQSLILNIQTQVSNLGSAVLAGTLSPDTAANSVTQLTASVNSVVDRSAQAISTGQSMLPMLAVASSIAGALAVPTWAQQTPMQDILGTLVQPAARVAMDAATAAQVGPRAGMSHSELLAEVERMAGLLQQLRNGGI